LSNASTSNHPHRRQTHRGRPGTRAPGRWVDLGLGCGSRSHARGLLAHAGEREIERRAWDRRPSAQRPRAERPAPVVLPL